MALFKLLWNYNPIVSLRKQPQFCFVLCLVSSLTIHEICSYLLLHYYILCGTQRITSVIQLGF